MTVKVSEDGYIAEWHATLCAVTPDDSAFFSGCRAGLTPRAGPSIFLAYFLLRFESSPNVFGFGSLVSEIIIIT